MKNVTFDSSFALGADISWLPQMEKAGFVFRNKDGKEQDCLLTLKEYGLNAVRLRCWVNPSDDPWSGHCSTGETLALAKRCARAGFRVMVNLHYSDTWADPGKQVKPAAWRALAFDKLADKVYEYTRDTVKALADGGVTPEWVQIGNETNPGFLLPDGGADDFAKLTRLYNAGYRGLKEAAPAALSLIHLAEGNKTAFIRNYFDRLAEHGCDYDMIGLSYYPWWLNTDNDAVIDDLETTLRLLPERYHKDVMIVETGGEDEKEDESRSLLSGVLERCGAVECCRGVFYWEPQGARAWSRYALSAWRSDGRPTRAMDAYLAITR
jgi:arabinogalactan endo-1,4-beta-galactosidase